MTDSCTQKNAESLRFDFKEEEVSALTEKPVTSCFRSPKQLKSKTVPAHTLECDKTTRRRKVREWEITRFRVTALLGGGGTGWGEGLAESHTERLRSWSVVELSGWGGGFTGIYYIV